MRRVIAAVLGLLLLASPAFAGDLSMTVNGHSLSGLSDAQIANLQAQAAQMAEQNQKKQQEQQALPSPTTVEQVSKYAELGKSIGAGLASTAKELGVAVNDFAKTPIGKLAMIIIVVKLLGSQALHVIVGTVWWLVAIPLWIYFFRRMCLIDAKVIEQEDKGKKVRRTQYVTNATDQVVCTRWIMLFVLIAIVAFGAIILF